MTRISIPRTSVYDRGLRSIANFANETLIPLAPTFNSRDGIQLRENKFSAPVVDDSNCQISSSFELISPSIKTTITTSDSTRLEDNKTDNLEEGRSYLHQKYSSKLLLSLKDHPVIPGQLGPSDQIIENALKDRAVHIFGWLSDLYIKNAHKPNVAADIISLIGRLPSKVAYPYGPTLASGALSHESILVREAGLRAFENWMDKDSLNLMENSVVQPKWLDEYRKSIIQSIKDQ